MPSLRALLSVAEVWPTELRDLVLAVLWQSEPSVLDFALHPALKSEVMG
jgi:hypothetical protein